MKTFNKRTMTAAKARSSSNVITISSFSVILDAICLSTDESGQYITIKYVEISRKKHDH